MTQGYKRPFTDEEFEKMLCELTSGDKKSFNTTLYVIAEKTLKPKVRKWCSGVAGFNVLRNMEGDIMQEIYIRLMLTAQARFFKRKDRGGELNRDPDEFAKWMFTVARHITLNVKTKLERLKAVPDTNNDPDNEADMIELVPDSSYEEEQLKESACEALAEAFRIVLESGSKAHIALTWIAQSLFFLYNTSRIRSNEQIISEFSKKTLFEMRDILFNYAKEIEWIVITPQQEERINKDLNAEGQNNKGETGIIGNFKYEDFFMKKGGKASISDWVNRMDEEIKRHIKK